MGWWGPEIFGGDAPLDAVAELQNILSLGTVYAGQEGRNIYPIEDWDDGFREAMEGLLRENEAKVIEWVENEDSKCYKSINAEVLGAVYMATGGHMPDRVRDLAVELAAKDEWAMEEPESRRHRIITEFISVVQKYKAGKPVLVSRLLAAVIILLNKRTVLLKVEDMFDRKVEPLGGDAFTIGQVINEMAPDELESMFADVAESLVKDGRLKAVEVEQV